jgi:hypothetical protein
LLLVTISDARSKRAETSWKEVGGFGLEGDIADVIDDEQWDHAGARHGGGLGRGRRRGAMPFGGGRERDAVAGAQTKYAV